MQVNPSFAAVDVSPEAAWPDTVVGLPSAGGPVSYADHAADSSDAPPVQMLDPCCPDRRRPTAEEPEDFLGALTYRPGPLL